MAVAEENEVADMIGFILDDLRGEEQSAPYTISNTSKNEDAVFVFCYRIDDTRVMNITAQVFVTPIVPAAKRNIHQQSMLEGISQMRKQITKAGMRPYLKGRAPLENEIFASQECDEEDVGRGVTAMLSQDGRGMSELVAAHIKLPGADTGKSFIQPKLDGIRVLSVRRLGEVIMFTKGGKICPIVAEFKAELMRIFDKLPANAILDGELYIHEIPDGMLEKVSTPAKELRVDCDPYVGPLVPVELGKILGAAQSYGGKGAPTKRNESLAKSLEYHIFTMICPNDTDGARVRYDRLKTIVQEDTLESHWEERNGKWRKKGSKIYLVPALDVPTEIYSKDEKKRNAGIKEMNVIMEEILSMGYEGIMVYNGSAQYHSGKRSWDLIKLKHTETEWFLIVGVEKETSGKMMANLIYQHNGENFISGGKFSAATKKLFCEHPEVVIGKWAEIRFQKKNTGEILRDPKVLNIAELVDGEYQIIDFADLADK
jgi:hypothetical protein